MAAIGAIKMMNGPLSALSARINKSNAFHRGDRDGRAKSIISTNSARRHCVLVMLACISWLLGSARYRNANNALALTLPHSLHRDDNRICAGKTWKKLGKDEGLPEGDYGRIGLTISHSNPDRIYALIEASKNGLYRTDDGGYHWELVNSDPQWVTNRPFYFQDIAVDPQNENRLWLIYQMISASEDGGKTFKVMIPYNGIHPDHHAFWINPKDPSFIIDGNDGVDRGIDVRAQGGMAHGDIRRRLRRALGRCEGGGEAGGRGAAGQAGRHLDGCGLGLGNDRRLVVEDRRPMAVGALERRTARQGVDLDYGLLEEAGDAALETLAASYDDGVGTELLAHLREGVGQAAGAERLAGNGHADTTPMVSTLIPGAISL